MRNLTTLLLMVAAVAGVSAQEPLDKETVTPHAEAADSAAVAAENVADDVAALYRRVMALEVPRVVDVTESGGSSSQFQPVAIGSYVPGFAPLAEWKGGAVIATGSAQSLPGMMGIEHGALSMVQTFGRLTLTASVDATKYAGYRFLYTQYGAHLSLRYALSNRVALVAYGTVYNNGSPMEMSPGAAGYYGASSFGGYADITLSEHWGIMTGANAVRQAHTGRYEVEPIVTPYYKVTDDFWIAVPVGQIVNSIIQGNRDNDWSSHGRALPPAGRAFDHGPRDPHSPRR